MTRHENEAGTATAQPAAASRIHRRRRLVSTAISTFALLGLMSGAWATTPMVASAVSVCPAGTTDVGNGICAVTFDMSTSWTIPTGVYSVDVVAVGGGGGGGNGKGSGCSSAGAGGGGGGGQVVLSTGRNVTPGSSVAITLGAGGSPGGGTGGATSFVTPGVTITAAGGHPGGSGCYTTSTSGGYGAGGDSGSGKYGGSPYWTAWTGGIRRTPVGAGSPQLSTTGSYFTTAGGGGGGDYSGGGAGWYSTGGSGGQGTVPAAGLFSGQTTAYGGGGGGANYYSSSSGGAGVAGGGSGSYVYGVAGTAHTGGGGGGSGPGNSYYPGIGGNGGSGTLMVRFLNPASLATVSTAPASSVTDNAATAGGTVTDTGLSSVTERGVVYALSSTNPLPAIGGTGVAKVAATGSGLGVFSVSLSGLVASHAYSFNTYATNSSGTAYGTVATFTTTALASPPSFAYVARSDNNTVIPIDTESNTAGTAIAVGGNPSAVAITPDGSKAYVANRDDGTVSVIDTTSNTVTATITVGSQPDAIAITPNGSTAYVANWGSDSVTPINIATNTPGTAIAVDNRPAAIAVAPNGLTAYSVSYGANTVTPINTVTNYPGSKITVGAQPVAIAITPDGSKAYVANSGVANTVTPITLATKATGTPITVGTTPVAIAITPDGSTAYVAGSGDGTVTPITVATNAAGTAISVGGQPKGIAVRPDGHAAYVATTGGVVPFDTGSNSVWATIPLTGATLSAVAITPDQAPSAAESVNAAPAWSTTFFNASGSTVAHGTIASFVWHFGDGSADVTTTGFTTTHVYSAPGTYTTTVTETSSAGTSTAQVFTGQTMSRNGGPQARVQVSVTIPASTPVPVAYVTNFYANVVTPINTATMVAGAPIPVSNGPWAVAITPDGSTAYVTSYSGNTVTPIDTATNTTGAAITVGLHPAAIAISPNGHLALVANREDDSVTPIDLTTSPPSPGPAIAVGTLPSGVAITPDGHKAFVANNTGNSVTPIDLTVSPPAAGTAIPVGSNPNAVAITPDGATAYVTNNYDTTVTPIDVAGNTAGTEITVDNNPSAIAISPDGTTAYVSQEYRSKVSRIDTGTNTVGTPVTVYGAYLEGIAITPDGHTAFVADSNADRVNVIDTAYSGVSQIINVPRWPRNIAITPDQAPVARLLVTPALPGDTTAFDASDSTVAYGTIASYAWSFGDGTPVVTTTTPTTTHVYAAAGSYTATVTETSSAGTSTAQVFTGQTVSRNGGPQAQASVTFATVGLATTTALTPTAPTTVYGQAQQFTATVTVDPPATGTPTGTVQFYADGLPFGLPQALDGAGTASITVHEAPPGTHTIDATFSGDSLYASSGASTATLTVGQASTTTDLSSSLNPAAPGAVVTFAATVAAVSPGSGTPTGTVSFYDGSTLLGSAPLQSDGTTAFDTTGLASGTHSITAQYGGDTNFAGSTSTPVSQVINTVLIDTTTVVTGFVPNPVTGEVLSFLATVTPTSGSGTPTGQVRFYIDGVQFDGPATMSQGKAAMSGAFLYGSGSPHTVTAVYAGDGTYAGSTGSLPQSVSPADTSTTVQPSVNPSAVGQAVSFTATVAALYPSGAVTPQGTVTFYLDGSALGSPVTLDATSHATSIAVSNLTVGGHSVEADYTDNASGANYHASTGNVTQIVNALAASVSVATVTSPSVFGQPVTFTAHVAAVAPGGPTPTGSVQFTVDGANVGSPVTLDGSGNATSAAVSSLSLGDHTIGAAYGGDTRYGNAAATPAAQHVDQAATTTTVTPDSATTVYGQAQQFTATVTTNSPGAGTPTGTVQFMVDGGPYGAPQTIDAGGATSITLNYFTPSGHSVGAAYTGDTNHASSASDNKAWIVNRALTSSIVSSDTNPATAGATVTITATVSPVSPGAGTPTGSVLFWDGSTHFLTKSLPASGIVTFQTSTLSVGTHAISVSYTGDGNFYSSYSTTLSQVVNPNQLSQAITVNTPAPATALYGQAFTVAASASSGLPVSYGSSGSCSNTGATYTMTGGTGSCTVTYDQAGDSDYTAAPQVTETVAAIPAYLTIIASSPAAISYGDPAPAITPTYYGWVGSDGPSVLATPPTCATSYAFGAPVGDYATWCDGATAANYEIGYVPGLIHVGPADQIIVVTTPAPATSAFGQSFTVDAHATSGLPLVFGSSGACTNLDATYSMASGTGTCTVTIDQGGNSNWSPAPQVTEEVNAQPAAQSITVITPAPAEATFNHSFTVDASASSGLPVAYGSSGSCSNAGPTYTMTSGIGTCTVTFDQPGNENFSAALQVTATVTAQKEAQSITFDLSGLPPKTYGDPPFDISGYAGASSGLPVEFSTIGSGVCGVGGTTISISGAGTCTVLATQPGNDDYGAARSVIQPFDVDQAYLTVVASTPGVLHYNDPVPVIIPLYSGWVGSDNESVLSPPPTCGTTYVKGAPVGSYATWCDGGAAANYEVGYVPGMLTVQPSAQAITVNTPAPATAVFGHSFTVDASASSGLPVGYGSIGSCSNVGATYTMTSGVGTCTVTFDQPGDSNYDPAPQVTESVTAQRAAQSITFDLSGLPAKTYGDAPFSIASDVSASSGLTVALTTATPSVCTVSGTTVTIKSAGMCTIDANQAGDDDYSAAAQVSQPFVVSRAILTVTASSVSGLHYGDTAPAITPSYTGWVNGDGPTAITTAPTCGTTYAQGDAPGVYTSSCSGAAVPNYAMHYVNGTVTVGKAPLTVTADDKTVQYGDALPALTVQYTGLVLSQNSSVLGGTLVCNTSATVTGGKVLSPAGGYSITCSGLTSGNYAITFVAGTLTVGGEDTLVRLAQNNPHAVQVVTSGTNKGKAPALTFSVRVSDVPDGSYGDISKAKPVTITLNPVGPGSTYSCVGAVTQLQPATATTPGFEVLSCTIPAGTTINVYEVVATVGGSYYQGSDGSVLTVYDPTAGGSDAAGTITNPNSGFAADIAYSATYLKNGKQVQGRFLYLDRDGAGNLLHVLKGNVMSTLAINGNTASLTGKATLDGAGNYSYIATGIDNSTPNSASNPDRYGQKLLNGSGATVGNLTFTPVPVSTTGNVFVGKY